ncbi:MAG: hypothetical protein ACK5WZ_14910 [Pseudobdellovibrionaceae bacterium]
MNSNRLMFLCGLVVSLCFLSSAFGFYSNTGLEVKVSYEADYLMSGPKPSEADVIWELRQSAYYMSGPLQFNSPKAGPKFDHSVRIISIVQGQNSWVAKYQFTGTFIVENKNTQNLKLYVPRSIRQIYKQSLVPAALTKAGQNPCIQDSFEDHMNETYFWYFWNPNKKGCPLKAGIHYDIITPKIEVLNAMTVESYPEYSRLPNSNGDLEMLLVFGADKDALGMKAPESNNDHNAGNFRNVLKNLKKQGFVNRRWTADDFQFFCKTNSTTTQTIEELTRMDGNRQITIRMLWGTSSVGKQSYPFHCLLNHAVANASVVIYNGHSGLGASVFLQQLKQDVNLPFYMNTNQYQIFAFNGCSSYGYYNLDFFQEKKTASDPQGTKNLDVITNGIAGNFYDLGKMTMSVVDSVLDWSSEGERTSYQEIIRRMKTPYMTAVNGDEDNSK